MSLDKIPARVLQCGCLCLPGDVSSHAVQPAHVLVDPWDPLNKSTITHNHNKDNIFYR